MHFYGIQLIHISSSDLGMATLFSNINYFHANIYKKSYNLVFFLFILNAGI